MSERYARNIGLIGAYGQRRVEQTRVAIIGYGGLGSHLGQQLAYLGTRDFVVVDGDIISESNLHRLAGAVPADIDAELRKDWSLCHRLRRIERQSLSSAHHTGPPVAHWVRDPRGCGLAQVGRQ